LYCAPTNGYILHIAGTRNGAGLAGRSDRQKPAEYFIGTGSHRASGPLHGKQEFQMAWSAPIVSEICVGMEVTSYESAEIDTFN
jgi:coenzyme PQQ precursor peptide PqqA